VYEGVVLEAKTEIPGGTVFTVFEACKGGTMMKIILNLCVSVFLAGAVLVSIGSARGRDRAQPFDDTPFDPIAVENGSAGWFPSIYGPGDQLGSLNEVTPEKTLEALRLIVPNKKRPPKTYNLGELMEPGINAFGNRVYEQTLVPPSLGPDFPGDNDIVGSEERYSTTYQIATQVDGLPHIGVRSVFYNGFTAAEVIGGSDRPPGAAVLGQEHVNPFITRGILLDVLSVKLAQGTGLGEPVNGKPILADSYRITVEDLRAAMKLGNIRKITPGDVVIIRTGWTHLFGTDPTLRDRYIGREPGIYLREARWLAQFRPAIIASDTPALEVLPAPAPWTATQFFPVHQELLTHHGIRIGEAFRSEELAADRVYEFVFFYTPQRAKGATASNTAPAALAQPNFHDDDDEDDDEENGRP
jgi:kynurenine formamidase